MKNTFLVIGTAGLFLLGTTFTGCNGSGGQNEASEKMHENHEQGHEEHHEHSDEHEHMEGEHAVMYHCPMNCEEDKMYDEPGQCPVCGMDMEKVEVGDNTEADHMEQNNDDHHGHDH